jgi:hypothetical protein
MPVRQGSVRFFSLFVAVLGQESPLGVIKGPVYSTLRPEESLPIVNRALYPTPVCPPPHPDHPDYQDWCETFKVRETMEQQKHFVVEEPTDQTSRVHVVRFDHYYREDQDAQKRSTLGDSKEY